MHGIRSGAFLPPEALSDAPTIAAAAAHAVALARAGDSRKGLALALRARQQARGLEIAHGELEALNAAAIVHAMRGDHIGAVAAGIDAYELGTRLGDRTAMGHALVTLSHSAFLLGALPEALSALDGAVAQAASDGDTGLEIRARNARGIVLGDMGRFDEAAAELESALHLVRGHRVTPCPSRIIANLGNLSCKRARRAQALGKDADVAAHCAAAVLLADEAIATARGEPNVPVEIDALAIRGRAAALAGDPMAALERLATACETGVLARCRTPLPWILCERGRMHLAIGEVEAARKAYALALEIAEELRPSMKVGEACTGLARAESARGNELGARRWAERSAAEEREFDHLRLQARRQLEAFFAAAG